MPIIFKTKGDNPFVYEIMHDVQETIIPPVPFDERRVPFPETPGESFAVKTNFRNFATK